MSLGDIIRGVFELRSDMRTAGATDEALLEATTTSIRSAWPQIREWKYLCQTCHDYGLEMGFCPGDRTCGREKQHLAHDFGRPCWCSHGAKFRKAPKPDADADFSQAGKTTKRLTKFGR